MGGVFAKGDSNLLIQPCWSNKCAENIYRVMHISGSKSFLMNTSNFNADLCLDLIMSQSITDPRSIALLLSVSHNVVCDNALPYPQTFDAESISATVISMVWLVLNL